MLYAVKNKSWVFRLVKQGGLWVPDTSNGWGAGKEIFFPGSTDPATNQPDSEGLTIGADGALYVTTERNNAANTIPLNSILRFDPTQPGTQLVATDQWNLTAEFPELHAGNKTEANLGFEGVTFVPDAYLTANGFVDQSTGKTYRPIDYPTHGGGLYFAALENDGKLYAYALSTDHTFHRVAVVDTGMGHVMDVQFDADTQRIWALCDNTCGVTTTVLKVSSTGTIVPEVAYSKPASLPVNNLEGFALAPELDLCRRHQGGALGGRRHLRRRPGQRNRGARALQRAHQLRPRTSAHRACRHRMPGPRRRSTTPATR